MLPHARGGLALGCALWLAAGALRAQEPAPGASAHGSPAQGEFSLELDVETPRDGARVADPGGTAFVAGRALARAVGASGLQIVFVIDQSQSTIAPSGDDVNGDGETGRWGCDAKPHKVGALGSWLGLCGESGDSVLSAELLAARTLLQQLDPRSTQVGIVAFSGDEDPRTPDAHVVAGLTSDYDRLERALREIAAEGPHGFTNMQAAVQVAARELTRTPPAAGEAHQRVILFLSDGQPTLPSLESGVGNRRLAIEAARAAASAGLRIDSYGIGNEALANPDVLVEMARVSGGVFTPVLQPRKLQSVFAQLRFSEIDELRITNRTQGSRAHYVSQGADGSFSALLDMVPGHNQIEVYARAKDGAEQTRTLGVEFEIGASSEPLSPHLVDQRNRLLELRLAELRERSLSVQVQRDEDLRRALEQRIERTREQERLRRLRIEPERCTPAEEEGADGACDAPPPPRPRPPRP